MGLGGSYNVYITEATPGLEDLVVDIEETTDANSVHMMLLLPQYIILTCGEILFSITGLEFAYTQSPASMKAVVQALYLLTTAGGNLIDWIVVAALSPYFKKQRNCRTSSARRRRFKSTEGRASPASIT